jgi:hypothetical protein
MSYDNELRGVLFRNKAKRPDKKDPDYRGRATVHGVEFWLDAWISEPQSGGEKFMSIKFKPKAAPAEKSKPKAAAAEVASFDDDIPF